MTEKKTIEKAMQLFRDAYGLQMEGKLDLAVRFYQKSINCHPTAEAYTYLGWTFSFLGRYEDAIDECKKAIEADATFGNPYNDIGAYLINLGQLDEAIPWLEQATRADRYASFHYPHCNLGRVYMEKGMLKKALEEFQQALVIEPNYLFALQAVESIELQLQ